MIIRSTSLKPRRSYTLEDFRGVDYSSSALSISPHRASRMRNLINDNGVNHKRHGWHQLTRLEGRINGIYPYTIAGTDCIVVHHGTDITVINATSYEEIISKSDIALDAPSDAVITAEAMYVATGNGIYKISSTEKSITSLIESAYIPTTMISIDPESDTGAVGRRALLDDVNLLTNKRINRLVGSEFSKASWQLDSPIAADTEVLLSINTISASKSYKSDGDLIYEVEKDGNYVVDEEGNKGDSVGSIDRAKGILTLEISTAPPASEGYENGNIFVTFTAGVEDGEGGADRSLIIGKCTICTTFGVNGNTDRLFLSGNPDYPNIVYFSDLDFAYFPDVNTSICGANTTPIKAFSRLSDSTLAVHKGESGQDSTLFLLTGKYRETYDENGNIDTMRAQFTVTAAGIGEGVISGRACRSLAGDPLILSSSGVYGITISEDVAATKHTVPRSSFINGKLVGMKNLSKACAAVMDNRYYLAIDGEVFVADARFKVTDKDGINGAYTYEWWHWDNVPAITLATAYGKLWFGTEDGRLCAFSNGYEDITYTTLANGELEFSPSINGITHSIQSLYSLREGDTIEIPEGSGLFEVIIDEADVIIDEANEISERIKASNELIGRIYTGLEVYADNVDDTGLELDTPYYVTDISLDDNTFSLTDDPDNLKANVEITGSGFALKTKLDNVTLYLTNVECNEAGEVESFQLKRHGDLSDPIALSRYNNGIVKLNGARFSEIRPVRAEWYTPILNLGTVEYLKTLTNLTIATEPEVNGNIEFGYETRQVDTLLRAKGIGIFSFENMSFESFSLETKFASAYSIRRNVRNFNYIILRFISSGAYDSVVNGLTLTYKLNKFNKGVN